MKYSIEICRTSYTSKMVTVEASSSEEASEKAMDMACSMDFPNEYDSEYSIENIKLESGGNDMYTTSSGKQYTLKQLVEIFANERETWINDTALWSMGEYWVNVVHDHVRQLEAIETEDELAAIIGRYLRMSMADWLWGLD